MTTLLLGKTGYLGSFLARQIECVPLGRNVTWPAGNLDAIINCAGLITLEECELHPEASYEANVALVRDVHKIPRL